VNVAELQSFASADQFLAHARGLPRVILEGRSDVDLFKSWFEDLQSEFDFIAAEEIGPAGGCTGVQPAVRLSWDQDIPALGIVDRDYLHRSHRWELLFAVDHEAIADASEDPDVAVASLWEIEAYLLAPELLSLWVGVTRSTPPASSAERAAALGRAVEECEALLDATPFFASGHAAGERFSERYFHGDQAARIAEVCRTALEAAPADRQATAEEIQDHVSALRAAAPAENADRLRFYLRYVDTRRLLARLEHRLGLNAHAHHALSVLMKERGLKPTEFEALLQTAGERFSDLEA